MLQESIEDDENSGEEKDIMDVKNTDEKTGDNDKENVSPVPKPKRITYTMLLEQIKGFYHGITKIFLLVGSYSMLSWHFKDVYIIELIVGFRLHRL